jgi:hypothetical protein
MDIFTLYYAPASWCRVRSGTDLTDREALPPRERRKPAKDVRLKIIWYLQQTTLKSLDVTNYELKWSSARISR